MDTHSQVELFGRNPFFFFFTIIIYSSVSWTHRDEEYATEQGPGESWFDDLFVALAGCAVASQQSRDVERHLSDGAKRGVHHCSHGKVTLCRDAVETNGSRCLVNHIGMSLNFKGRYYLAMPIPMKYDRGIMEMMAVVNLVTEVK